MASTPLLVSIIDEDGAPFSVDQVTLTLNGAPVAQTAAPFAFDVGAAGSASLVIEKAGHHTYQFALDVTATGADFTVGFSKSSMVDSPRMASIFKATATASTRKVVKNLLTVRIGPVREVVLVMGYDYHSNTNFRALGTTRMHDLAAARGLSDSTVITTLEMQTGDVTRWVRGRGKEKLGSGFRWAGGWTQMTVTTHPTPNLNQTLPDYPGPGTIGITDVYRYLEEVGRLRPGSVQEFSVLSHSWFGGPIMFNTNEHAEFGPTGARRTERDPADKDARFWKDFNSTNMPQIADFKAAFSSTSLVKMWGCFAVRIYRNMINAARTATTDTQALGIPAADRTGWFPPNTVFPDTRPGIVAFLRQSAFMSNFMFQLSKVIGRPVAGGGPGMGALFLPVASGLRMYMPARQLSVVGNAVVEGVTIYQREIDFLESALGWSFDENSYLLYQP